MGLTQCVRPGHGSAVSAQGKERLGPFWARAPEPEALGSAGAGCDASAYLLMRGCRSDSKTRLQLSWHLLAPRISTTIPEEGTAECSQRASDVSLSWLLSLVKRQFFGILLNYTAKLKILRKS